MDDRIRARNGFGLKEGDELSRDERVIHQAIRDARKPLTEASILAHTRYGAVVSPMKLKIELRESCVLVPMGDGTYDALHPSTRLRRVVLNGHPATEVAAIASPPVLAVPVTDGPLLAVTASPAQDDAPIATASVTNRRSPLFVVVGDVWQGGVDGVWQELAPHVPEEERVPVRERLARLAALLHREVPVDLLHNFSYEEVTNSFVRDTSRGTRLKAAELAIAQIAQRLPNMISDDVAAYVAVLKERGWQFDDQFLLRCPTAVARDRSSFKHLISMDRADVTASWGRLVPAMDAWLALLKARLGLTSMDFIASAHSHIVPVAWIVSEPTRLLDDKLLEWFVHFQIWSRYTGLGESAIDADLQRLRGARSGNPFPGLSQNLRSSGQSARVTQGDLQAATRQSSLRLLMYLAARNTGAQDLLTGERIGGPAPGTSQAVVMQPVFPSTAIRRQAPGREANELTNYVVLAQDVKATKPTGDMFRYLPDVPHSRLADAAIPADPALWEPTRFRDFIRERRRLLAAHMNEALKSLADAAPVASDARPDPEMPGWMAAGDDAPNA